MVSHVGILNSRISLETEENSEAVKSLAFDRGLRIDEGEASGSATRGEPGREPLVLRRVGTEGEGHSDATALAVGILPLAKSTKLEWASHSHFESQDEWLLVGNGEKYSDCGSVILFGCDNVDGHNVKGLMEDFRGKVYVEMRRRTCLRAECPVCYEKWAGKEASKIEYRLKAFRVSRLKVIHVVISPSVGLDIAVSRRKVYKIAKEAGIIGGCVIIHPWRSVCAFCGSTLKHGFKTCYQCGGTRHKWKWSPHFHLLGFGWVKNVKAIHTKTGWIIKNLGVRKTVGGSALYQLSHAGVKKKTHTVTWFGQLSYNKLKIPKMLKPEKPKCPLCGNELRRILIIKGT